MIKILALTCGGISVASSRLRSFYPFQAADKSSYQVNRVLTYQSFVGSDVIHFQKTLNPFQFFLNIFGRLLGKVTVFDVDDQPHNIFVACAMNMNVLISKLIVVDTEERRAYWVSRYPFKKVIVIPDVCDGVATSLPQISYPRVGEELSVVWIGHPTNIWSIESLLKYFQSSSEGLKLKLTVISNLSELSSFMQLYEKTNFVEWRENILLEDCDKYHFMILNHDFDDASRMKSDNKMVLSFMAGIMPIVSATPSYKRLAAAVNLEKIVFDDLTDVFEIVRKLDIEDFSKIADVRNWVLNKYSNANFFKSLMLEVHYLTSAGK